MENRGGTPSLFVSSFYSSWRVTLAKGGNFPRKKKAERERIARCAQPCRVRT
jgi:hypothetical protein